MRDHNMATTVRYWSAVESKRPERLDRTLQRVPPYFEDQAEDLDRNLAGASQLIQRDVERFEERQPRYLEKTDEILWGKPGRIERSAVVLFI